MRTILVPLDGSAFAEHALGFALGTAKRAGARLRLVSVYEGAPPIRGGQGALTFDTRLDAELRAGLRAYLEDCRRRLGHVAPAVQVDTAVLDGEAAEAIAEHARASDAALVVLTTHGRRGLSRAWLGSVADDLVRRLAVPALVVRPRDGDDPPRLDGAGVMRRVVIALDGSAASEAAIEPAVALAGVDGVRYTLLRAAVAFDPMMLAAKGARAVRHYLRDERAIATAYLDALVSRLAARGLTVDAIVPEGNDPAKAIIDFADEAGADLVAMATHGLGPFGRFLLGSVADKVLRAGSTPMLLCHAAEGEGASNSAMAAAGAAGGER